MSIMRGVLFEKVGVNISTVLESFQKNLDHKFQALKKAENFGLVGYQLLLI